jgi:hypothetical protein
MNEKIVLSDWSLKLHKWICYLNMSLQSPP